LNTQEQKELIPMGVGDLLFQARRKKGLDLATVAAACKVRPEILSAIESGETSQIPSVYLKGHIRSCARYLGIPLSSIESHVAQARGAEPGVQSIFKAGPPRHSGDRWIKASSYVIASVVVIALVWQFTTEAVRFSQGDPLLRPVQGRTADGDDSRSISAADDTPTHSGSGIKVKPANSHLRASIASISTTGEAVATDRPALAEGAWAAIGQRDLTTGAAVGSATQPVSLRVTTSADSWVEIVDSEGVNIEMDLLRAGSSRDYSGAGPFRVLLGRASSVELFHNGEKVDLAPYTRGNVARLTLGAEDLGAPAADIPDSETTAAEPKQPEQG